MSGGCPAPPSLWRVSGLPRILAVGSLLNATAFFAALPFGALYLDEYTGLGKPAIGAVVGSIALIGAVGGVGGGMVVDRFGATRLMRAGLGLTVGIYLLLSVIRAERGIVILFVLLGVARLLVEPSAKKLLSIAGGEDGRIFRLRYMTLCAGAILGPLMGGVLYHASIVAFFLVPAVFYSCYLLLISLRAGQLNSLEQGSAQPVGYPFGETLRDRRLLAAIAAGVVIFFVFSQLESMVPLVMRDHYGDNTESLFALLLVGNAILALLLQSPIDRLSARLRQRTLVLLGCAAFAVSFGLFGAMSISLIWLYFGILFWTIGEGILLPMPDIAVHQIAQDDRKGAYFGLAELRYAGFFAGPIAGGWLLAYGGVYFLVMAVAIVACVPFLSRQPRVGTDGDVAPAEPMAEELIGLDTPGAAVQKVAKSD